MVELFPVNQTPCKLQETWRIFVKTDYARHYPEKAFDETGKVVAVLSANRELSDAEIMRFYGKYVPGVRKVSVDRIVLQKPNGSLYVVPYRPDLFIFERKETL